MIREALMQMLLVAQMESGPAGVIRCDFPAATQADEAIAIHIAAHPSLRDRPGLFRATLDLNGTQTVAASVQPIQSTEDDDVVIKTRGGASSVALGLRADGRAALSIKAANGEATRMGDCQGHAAHLQRWLGS